MQQLVKLDFLSALLVTKVQIQGYPWSQHQHPPSCCFHRSQAFSSCWRPLEPHLVIHTVPWHNCYNQSILHVSEFKFPNYTGHQMAHRHWHTELWCSWRQCELLIAFPPLLIIASCLFSTTTVNDNDERAKEVWLSTWQQICSLYNSINLHTVCATLSMIISQFLRLYKFSAVYKYSDFSATRHFFESPLRPWDKPPQYCLQGLVSFARWLCRVLLTESLKCLT